MQSWKQSTIFTGIASLQPFADLMACNVHVKFNPGPLVTFESKTKKVAKTELKLECRGGVHFNVLQGET